MPTFMRRLAVPALVAGVAASCLYPEHVRTVSGDPVLVESRSADVFVRFLIPVAERVSNQRVESGWFRADRVWGQGASVAARVDCGHDSRGRNRAAYQPVELSISLRVRPRPGGVSLSLRSQGRTVPEADSGEEATRCRLQAAFAEEVLSVIAGTLSDPFPPGVGRGPGDVRRP
jgi:hypothetical protein